AAIRARPSDRRPPRPGPGSSRRSRHRSPQPAWRPPRRPTTPPPLSYHPVAMSISPERAGHGINQRALIRMSSEEVDAYLRQPHTMVMCTINRDSTIHAVAMYYGFLEGCVAFETKTKSQKVQNLR